VKWWEAPEYDRRQPMNFPDRRGDRQRRVGKHVEFADGRWRSTPIRVYVGPASHC
jgi:hypothetical protein